MSIVMKKIVILFGFIIILSGCGMQEKQTGQKREQTENAVDLDSLMDGEFLFSFGVGDDTYFKEMEEAPKDKYLFILDRPKMLMLNENNEILLSNANSSEVTVQGDYFHALPYQTLAVSYSDLVDEKHLMKQKRS